MSKMKLKDLQGQIIAMKSKPGFCSDGVEFYETLLQLEINAQESLARGNMFQYHLM